MNWARKQVIKLPAQKRVGLAGRNLGTLAEERSLWEKIQGKSRVFDACPRAVEHESATLSVFEQRRAEAATALRYLCENEVKCACLRLLLINMGNRRL